jgi:hypothetical protein
MSVIAEAKNRGFSAAPREIDPGQCSFGGGGCSHWATVVWSIERRRTLYHYSTTSSPAPVHSRLSP